MKEAIEYIERRMKETQEEIYSCEQSDNKLGVAIFNTQLIALKDLRNVLILLKNNP